MGGDPCSTSGTRADEAEAADGEWCDKYLDAGEADEEAAARPTAAAAAVEGDSADDVGDGEAVLPLPVPPPPPPRLSSGRKSAGPEVPGRRNVSSLRNVKSLEYSLRLFILGMPSNPYCLTLPQEISRS